MKKSLRNRVCGALLSLSAPAFAYVIKLKDGSLIFARTKYTVKGDRAIITLENGTVTAIKLDEIDVEGSEKYNKENFGNVIAIDTPDSRKPTPVPEAPQPAAHPGLHPRTTSRAWSCRDGRAEAVGGRLRPVVRHGRPGPPDRVHQGLRRGRDHAVQADELPREDRRPRHDEHRGERLQRPQRDGARAVGSRQPRRVAHDPASCSRPRRASRPARSTCRPSRRGCSSNGQITAADYFVKNVVL